MRLIVSMLALLAGLAGCSSEQLYNAGASARRQECSQMLDRDSRERCEKNANRTYREYEQMKKP